MEKNEQNKKEIKKIKLKMKARTLVIVFVLLIIFIASNVFASVKGYRNIFFMIKDLTKTKETAEMSEILEDRDILISYKSIEIADGVKVQINELILKDGEGKLSVKVALDSINNKNVPEVIKVYDMDNNNKLLGNHNTTRDDNTVTYFEEILLKDIKNNTNKLKLEFRNKENEEIAVIKVDLANKEVLIGEDKEKEISKLSEVELKQILGDYVLLNKYKDQYKDGNYATILTEQQFKNGQMVEIAIEYICNKNPDGVNGKFEVAEVNKIIKEFTGKEITGPLDIGESFGVIEYNKNSKKYEFLPGEGYVSAKCLEIEKLSFADGVYTVTFSYCYPSGSDWKLGIIEDLPVYKTTMKFKLNENYEYTKYCLVDLDEVKSEKVKENTSNVNVLENNKNEENNTSNANAVSNTEISSDIGKNEETIDYKKLVKEKFNEFENIREDAFTSDLNTDKTHPENNGYVLAPNFNEKVEKICVKGFFDNSVKKVGNDVYVAYVDINVLTFKEITDLNYTDNKIETQLKVESFEGGAEYIENVRFNLVKIDNTWLVEKFEFISNDEILKLGVNGTYRFEVETENVYHSSNIIIKNQTDTSIDFRIDTSHGNNVNSVNIGGLEGTATKIDIPKESIIPESEQIAYQYTENIEGDINKITIIYTAHRMFQYVNIIEEYPGENNPYGGNRVFFKGEYEKVN